MEHLFSKQNVKKTLVAVGVISGLVYSMKTNKSLTFTAVAALGLGIVGGLVGEAVIKS